MIECGREWWRWVESDRECQRVMEMGREQSSREMGREWYRVVESDREWQRVVKSEREGYRVKEWGRER